ncbi:hypothetical protein DMC25_06720 [Caulobacter sp. D4A]|uniref:hypothetical protein n=1 Tax=unclassified Caulobacter TaxID=2648921 RepID=UPI000D739CF6|nr:MULTISPECIES: hypothetical protein [unclassified Caulobacter]PXA90298.1 hypothetical protein DMC18_15035 [Caulobacter sp. D5]PXA90917.1 hypothetical protein DMC25_06720 [Caulobacter sp. D4A]
MDALNYPYIRVRDANWLKQTLLLFPHVARMRPRWAPPDDPEIETFRWAAKDQNPLLRSVNLHSQAVRNAQRRLMLKIAECLETDEAAFRARFAKEAFEGHYNASADDLWGQRLNPSAGFQIHADKIFYHFSEFLEFKDLCWAPERPHGEHYLEVHPRLGAAIMTTLAFAAARDEGLRVVTEFPDLHGQMIAAGDDNLLHRLSEGDTPKPEPINGHRIAEIIVYQRCDVGHLSAEDMVALTEERAAFARFRQALEEEAKALPPEIGNPKILQQYLDDTVNDILARWQKDRAGFTPLAKAVFGDEAINEPRSLLQKIAEKALTSEVGGSAATGTLMGGLTNHTLAGAAAGCAIGLAVHTLKSWRQVAKREAESPWKYLTTLEKGGVGFRMVA